MTWFAGAFSQDPQSSGRTAVESLGRGRDALTAADGPFGIAADPLSVGPDGAVCAIAGTVHGLPELAAELGLPPGGTPHATVRAGFERWGSGVIERMRGPFAIALWNPNTGHGLLGQDLMSASAVFVHRSAAGLVFATEVRDLLALLRERPGPD